MKGVRAIQREVVKLYEEIDQHPRPFNIRGIDRRLGAVDALRWVIRRGHPSVSRRRHKVKP